MSKIVFDDGREIKISDETEQELRKAFDTKEFPMLGYLKFSDGNQRIYLDCSKLSAYTKSIIKTAIKVDGWVTFRPNGEGGSYGKKPFLISDCYHEVKNGKTKVIDVIKALENLK